MFRFLLSISIGVLLNISSFAHAEHNHAKHNMILFGENEVFASHIVYKSPHNYQVILSLNLGSNDLKEYLDARAASPGSQFIYLLDAMDIKDIDSVDQISGSVFYIDSNGQKHGVIQDLIVARDRFKVIYYDELPLSLEADNAVTLSKTILTTPQIIIKCGDKDETHGCAPPPEPICHPIRKDC